MPGVLIVEAMAQCAAVLILRDIPNREEKLFLFGGVDKARFRSRSFPAISSGSSARSCSVGLTA